MNIPRQKTSMLVLTLLSALCVGSAGAADSISNKREAPGATTGSNSSAMNAKRNARIHSQWKKETWRAYQEEMKFGTDNDKSELPETDCPPLKPEKCLDTWE